MFCRAKTTSIPPVQPMPPVCMLNGDTDLVCAEVTTSYLKELLVVNGQPKTKRFSFTRMRSVVIPPVAIPSKLRSHRAVNTLVSGKEVALTRTMWENQKKRTIKRQQLDMIDEDSVFDYPVLRS